MKTLDVQYIDILDECITHLQDGVWTLDTCLARYPLYAEDLKTDLAVFQTVRSVPKSVLPADHVTALEKRLRQQYRQTMPKAQSQQRSVSANWYRQPFMRWVAGLVFMLLLLVGGGGGTVMAASNSLPGDQLYVVKTTWEQVVVAGATLINEQDRVWLQLAETRADEIIRLHELGRLNDITDDVIDEFYATAENAILYATPDTASDYVAMTETVRPAFEETILATTSESQGFRILRVLNPTVTVEGILIMPAGEEFLPEPQVIMTVVATATYRPTFTATATSTPTSTLTATYTATPTFTRTPTPSRTPTLTASPVITSTFTPTASPTLTFTPLPIGTRIDGATVEDDTGEQVSGDGLPRDFFTGENQYFIRQTEQAVYLTQTALAPTEQP